MSQRNRSQGWTHAKKSGHLNEEKAAYNIKNCTTIQKRLSHISGYNNLSFQDVTYGGIHETKVESIIENSKTTSKTDIIIPYNNSTLNISLKKESSGQVFLVSTNRFINGFETQYSTCIPNDVKQALYLFFGFVDDTLIKDIVNTTSSSYHSYEIRKNRLTAETLKVYDKKLYEVLLLWFSSNIKEIFDFCFIRGLAKNDKDFAHIIWYKNFLNENSDDFLFNLNELKDKLPNNAEYGSKNGGTTIQLPFGFLQWHNPSHKKHGDMQFHHSLDKLLKL